MKKFSLAKIFFIILVIILIVYLIFVCSKWLLLTNMSKNYETSKNLNNYSYIHESQTSTIHYWQKDHMKKLHFQLANGEGDFILWEDTRSGEKYTFQELGKTYSVAHQGISSSLPRSSYVTDLNEMYTRFLYALNPTIFILVGHYEERSCYSIHSLLHGDVTETVDQETGLLVYGKTQDGSDGHIRYTFNQVTDLDVEKPDLSQYVFVEKSQ